MNLSTAIAAVNAELESGRDVSVPGIIGRGAILWARCDRIKPDSDGRGARRVRYGRVPRDSYFFGHAIIACAGMIQGERVAAAARPIRKARRLPKHLEGVDLRDDRARQALGECFGEEPS